ncbi:MAG: hypothetical protein HUJ51_05385 [Eggerthellaceae bacterium]|nr:hypothetical protein [Eggerthellaceae bacterium]
MTSEHKTFQEILDPKNKPEFELSDYRPLVLQAKKLVFDYSDVEFRFKEMCRQFPDFEDIDDAPIIAQGMTVRLKLNITDEEGEPFPNLYRDSFGYVVGSNVLHPDFEKNILGMQLGEKRKFSMVAPKVIGPKRIEEVNVDFEITYLANCKQVDPTPTDEWIAKRIPLFKNIEEAKQFVKHSEEQYQTDYYNTYMRGLASTKVANLVEGEIPEDIFFEYCKLVLAKMEDDLRASGSNIDEFKKQIGGIIEFEKHVYTKTRKMLYQGYALDAVYRHFKLEYSDEDIVTACREINPEHPLELRVSLLNSAYKDNLIESAQRICAGNHLVENANIEFIK